VLSIVPNTIFLFVDGVMQTADAPLAQNEIVYSTQHIVAATYS
jgi:hypothetical protein